MNITNPTVPILSDPQGIEAALLEITNKIVSPMGITWVNNAFGKALERRRSNGDKKEIKYPCVFVGNDKDYLSLLPDSHLGNFCFFLIEDGEKIVSQSRKNKELETKISIIFWYDFRLIYPNPQDPNTFTDENVKVQVLEFFKTNAFFNSQIIWETFYNKADNIYKGFTHNEIDNQFLMRPFGGFRLEGKIRYFEKNKC